MKEINILGVSVKECSLREALSLTEEYLKNGALNTVLYVSAKMLVEAGKNLQQKEWIESMDLTVCAEPDILRAVNAASVSRIREIESNAYLKAVIRRLAKEKQSVCLLTEKESDIIEFEDFLREMGPRLNMAAQISLEAVNEDLDELVNCMNDIAADVIISRIPYRRQEQVIAESRNYLNSEVWLALPQEDEIRLKHGHLLKKTIRRLFICEFKRKVVQYKETE